MGSNHLSGMYFDECKIGGLSCVAYKSFKYGLCIMYI